MIDNITDSTSHTVNNESTQNDLSNEKVTIAEPIVDTAKDNELVREDDPKGFTKRINKIYAKSKEWEEQAKKTDDRNKELENKILSLQKKMTAADYYEANNAQDGNYPQVPDRDSFEDPRDYTEAHSKWVRDTITYEKRRDMETELQTEREKYYTNLTNSYNASVNRVKKSCNDFDEKIKNLNHLNYTQAFPDKLQLLKETIWEMPNGAEVAYYLANNLDEAQGVIDLPSKAAIMQLGKIQDRVLAGVEQNYQSPTLPPDAPPIAGRQDGIGAPRRESIQQLRERLRKL